MSELTVNHNSIRHNLIAFMEFNFPLPLFQPDIDQRVHVDVYIFIIIQFRHET